MLKTIHGFILKKISYLEKHLIVKIFSKEISKISAIGIGAKKSKKRNLNLLDYFNFLKFTLYTKKKYPLFIIERVDLVDTFIPKNIQLKHIIFIEILNEIIDNLVYGEEETKNLFYLYYNTIKDLKNNLFEKLCIFKIKALTAIGLQLNYSKCIICGKNGTFLNYSIEKMGFICNNCKSKVFKIKLGTIKTIEYIEKKGENIKFNQEVIRDINKLFYSNLINLRNKEKAKRLIQLENRFKWILKN